MMDGDMMNAQEKSVKFERPLFVINPVAGTSDPEQVLNSFDHYCELFGWQPVVHETSQDDDLEKVVRAGLQKGCDVALAGGGDGTVAEVASALVGCQTPLGIIPLGTGNQLAWQLGLPADYKQAIELIGEQPEMICLDAMRIKERYFLLNASAGFSSAMIKQTTRQEKRKLGILAYFWNGIRLVLGIQPYKFILDIDGKGYSRRASEIFISNNFLFRNQDFLTDIEMRGDDGQVEVFVLKARTLWDYIKLFLSLFKRNIRQLHHLEYISAKQQVEINSTNPVPFQADGEILGTTPVRIEVIPQAIRVLVPSAKQGE